MTARRLRPRVLRNDGDHPLVKLDVVEGTLPATPPRTTRSSMFDAGHGFWEFCAALRARRSA